jgi:hypothetical protein
VTDEFSDLHKQDTAYVERQIAERRERLSEIAVELELSAGIGALAEHPTWKDVRGRLEMIRSGELDRMSRDRMDGYQLGYRQGKLRTLNFLTSVMRPLRSEEIEALQSESRRLQDQIETLSNLL